MEVPESVVTYVDSLIKSKKVVVFSKSYCPYCTKAKKAIEKYPVISDQYVVIELENREDCSQIQAYMQTLTGGSSVPRVFINGVFIGGGDDTVRLDKSGELAKKLDDCHALARKL